MRHVLVLAAIVLALPSLALADPPPGGIVHVSVPPGTSLREYGYQLFGGNCVMCHGSGGSGVYRPASSDELGPRLKGVGALAADFYLRTGYMPVRSAHVQPRRSRILFSDRELRALVAYVASLGPGPAIPQPIPGAEPSRRDSRCSRATAQGVTRSTPRAGTSREEWPRRSGTRALSRSLRRSGSGRT